ncbi:MAG: hypothetical protein IPM06_19045 [Rhizobiales bacterium]|nr:hypothetical protein [Hyphomicrobiales bacterium]
MAHARQAIREAAATLLTNLTTTGSRVFQSRMAPQESLPVSWSRPTTRKSRRERSAAWLNATSTWP